MATTIGAGQDLEEEERAEAKQILDAWQRILDYRRSVVDVLEREAQGHVQRRARGTPGVDVGYLTLIDRCVLKYGADGRKAWQEIQSGLAREYACALYPEVVRAMRDLKAAEAALDPGAPRLSVERLAGWPRLSLMVALSPISEDVSRIADSDSVRGELNMNGPAAAAHAIVGDLFGVSGRTIRSWLKRHSVEE